MKHSDFCRCGAIVDLNAIRRNLIQLRLASGGKKILSTVKANAYGHGAPEVAAVLQEHTDYFGVATVDEGVQLRTEGGITKPILIIGPMFSGEDDVTFSHGLTETVFEYERAYSLNENVKEFITENLESLKDFPNMFPDYRAHVHIAVDTGMSRIGLKPDASGVETIRKIMELGNVKIDGIFTHFATADEADKTSCLEAYAKFRNFKKLCQEAGIEIPLWHCANTAAVIDGIGLDDEMDMVRLGIGLYGMYPSEEVNKKSVPLQPAMLWYSYITYIKEIEPGTSVSYGYRFTAERKTRVATVCCGYADGYSRSLSKGIGEVLIGGKRCKILGSVCMDQFMVDVTDVPNAAVGVPVVLMGSDGVNVVAPEELAEKCGTINYEITCAISHRVPRKYV